MRLSICLLIGLASAVHAAPSEQVYKKVGDVELKLHVVTPAEHRNTDKRPAIVFFFGGGWTGGKPGQFSAHSAYLASRGMVAIEADYRVKSRHGTDPFTCVIDGKSAIRWVRAHAGELGIDPNRIAAGGGSAGGHVAACTSVISGFEDPTEDAKIASKPNALVLFNPVIDTGPEGYGHERLKERYVEISPVDHVRADLPPTLIFMGTADKTTPLKGHLRFLKQARAAGADCSLFTFADRGHGFFNKGRENDGPYRTTVHLMDQFFIRIKWLDGMPTIALDTPAEAQ